MKNLIVRIKDQDIYYLEFDEKNITKHKFKRTKIGSSINTFINFKSLSKKLKPLNGKEERYTNDSIVIIAQTKHNEIKYLYYVTPKMEVKYDEEQNIINLGYPIANGKIVEKKFISAINGRYIDIPFKELNNIKENIQENNELNTFLNYIPDNTLLLNCLYKQDLKEWIQQYKENLDNNKDKIKNYNEGLKLLEYIEHESLNDPTFYSQALGNKEIVYNINIRQDVVKQNSELGLQLFNEQRIVNG